MSISVGSEELNTRCPTVSSTISRDSGIFHCDSGSTIESVIFNERILPSKVRSCREEDECVYSNDRSPSSRNCSFATLQPMWYEASSSNYEDSSHQSNSNDNNAPYESVRQDCGCAEDECDYEIHHLQNFSRLTEFEDEYTCNYYEDHHISRRSELDIHISNEKSISTCENGLQKSYDSSLAIAVPSRSPLSITSGECHPSMPPRIVVTSHEEDESILPSTKVCACPEDECAYNYHDDEPHSLSNCSDSQLQPMWYEASHSNSETTSVSLDKTSIEDKESQSDDILSVNSYDLSSESSQDLSSSNAFEEQVLADGHVYENDDNSSEIAIPSRSPPKIFYGNRRPSLPPRIGKDPVLEDVIKEFYFQNPPWYWGSLSKLQAVTLLKDSPDGTFLVRDSSNDIHLFTISFRSSNQTFHSRLDYKYGEFSFFGKPRGHPKGSAFHLIEAARLNSLTNYYQYYLYHMLPGACPISVKLLKPISRFEVVPSLKYLSRFVIKQQCNHAEIPSLPVPSQLHMYLLNCAFYDDDLFKRVCKKKALQVGI